MLRIKAHTQTQKVKSYSNPFPLLHNSMKTWQLVAFLLCMFALSLILKPFEKMSTCSRPIEGPRSGGEYPEVYGPNGDGWPKGKAQRDNNEKRGMYPDDGEFSSDTATKNEAYAGVFMYKPFMKSWNPETSPPEPYLSDFSGFHR
jgi:hypothetical protein